MLSVYYTRNRNDNGSGFFIPEPAPRACTRYLNLARLINEFFIFLLFIIFLIFFQAPNPPYLARLDLG